MRAFLQDVFQRFGQFRAFFNQLVAAFAVRVVYRAGNGQHLAPHFARQPRGYQRTRFQGGFHHQYGLRKCGYQAVAAREVARQRAGAEWEFGYDRAFFAEFVGQFAVGRRIDAVYARPPKGHGAAVGSQCAAMGGRIDAGGHARNDGNPALGQAAAEVVGDTQCLWGGVAAADYGHGRAVQQFDVAAHEQHRRRGDAFRQHGGEVFIAQQQQAAVFLFRPFFGGFGGLFGFSAPVCPCFLRGFAYQYLPYGFGIRLPRGGSRAEMADKLQEGFRADVRHQCQPQPVMAFLSVRHAVFPFA